MCFAVLIFQGECRRFFSRFD